MNTSECKTIEEAIARDGYRLAYKSAMKYYLMAKHRGIPSELEDVLQACVLYAWQYRHAYNPEKGAYTTWIVHAAWGGASRWYYFAVKRHRERSLTIVFDDGTEKNVADEWCAYEEPVPIEGHFGELEPFITESEHEILKRYYVDGLTFRELDSSVTRETNRKRVLAIQNYVHTRIVNNCRVRKHETERGAT